MRLRPTVRRLATGAVLLVTLALLLQAGILPPVRPSATDDGVPTLVVRTVEVPLTALTPTGVRVEKQAEARRGLSLRPEHRVRFLAHSAFTTEGAARADAPRRIERVRPRRHLLPYHEHPPSLDDPVLPRLA